MTDLYPFCFLHAGLPCQSPEEIGAQVARVVLVLGILLDFVALIIGFGVIGFIRPDFPGHVLACFICALAGKCVCMRACLSTCLPVCLSVCLRACTLCGYCRVWHDRADTPEPPQPCPGVLHLCTGRSVCACARVGMSAYLSELHATLW